jgi:hypothetical protein
MLRTTLLIQAVYFFLTGIWPLLHMESFVAVTGPKTDVWLVKTVGALLIPVSATIALHAIENKRGRAAITLSVGSSAAFACIDFYYSMKHVISNTYIADGFIQLVFLVVVLSIKTKSPA